MTSPHKIVIDLDIGMIFNSCQKTFKTKFGLLKNRVRPKACRNFQFEKKNFGRVKFTLPHEE